MRLNANQTRTISNIYASTNDFDEMKRKINRLNKPSTYKQGLRSYVNFIAQNTLPSLMEYQPPHVNYTEADPNFPEEKLNARP